MPNPNVYSLWDERKKNKILDLIKYFKDIYSSFFFKSSESIIEQCQYTTNLEDRNLNFCDLVL